jgi:zinc protease
MFKGTKNTRPETIDRLTEDIGGLNNAFTADDLTNYYEVVPSNYLETLLWAEADRLGSLAVTEEHFHTERDVVIGEYDQRILAEPYGMLDELVNRESFVAHPYKRGVIGDPENLRAATLDDVVAFHRTFYRPDNAVLVVVGDFDPVQANAWIEPPQTAERTYTYRGANVPLPAVEYAYHIPAWRHPDAAALDIVETLLGMGKSSRLYQSLVYRQRVATAAHASADLREQPGLFSLRAIASTGTPIGDVRVALDAEIARLRDELPAADEMERVRTQIASSFVRSRQTYNNIAVALVRSAVERDDPGALNGDLDRYRAVTGADVQRVARLYLTVENRTTIEYLPL